VQYVLFGFCFWYELMQKGGHLRREEIAETGVGVLVMFVEWSYVMPCTAGQVQVG
jgi:hypothetical protein